MTNNQLVLESAADVITFARAARQCVDHVKGDGAEDNAELNALADAAIADAERLQATATKLAAKLRKSAA